MLSSVARSVTVLLLLAISITLFPSIRSQGFLFRPSLSEGITPGLDVSQPGRYFLAVGEIIELEALCAATPSSPNLSEIQVHISNKKVIKKKRKWVRKLNANNLDGYGGFVFLFKAKKRGESTITLSLDGFSYEYEFFVTEP